MNPSLTEFFTTLEWGRMKHPVYQCSLCPRDFRNPAQMEAHLQMIHAHEIALQQAAVSCIMPTIRPLMWKWAVRQWLFQSWKSKELILIVEPDLCQVMLPPHPRIRVLLEGGTIGHKRNVGCQAAKGAFIAHWDDDELHNPFRLESWLRQLVAANAQMGGVAKPYFQDPQGQVYQFQTPGHLSGSSLIYEKALWERIRFPDKMKGEDNAFIAGVRAGRSFEDAGIVRFIDSEKLCSLVHEGNTSPKQIDRPEYQFCPGLTFPHPKEEKVLLFMLSWNTEEPSKEAALALLEEARRLKALGYDARLCFVDNGSEDDTRMALVDVADQAGKQIPTKLIFNPGNYGNSIARNQMLDYAKEWGADWVLMTDGDLEIIPWSTLAMIGWLGSNPQIGVAGLYSGCYTDQRERIRPAVLDNLHPLRIEYHQPVAWTQYGMFRGEVFTQDGVSFEEGGPFGGPGWGFEDDDLHLQMKAKGWGNACFYGACYLHRAKQSSLPLLRRAGADPQKLFQERREFLLRKWGADPIMKAGLAKLAATELRE